MDIETLKQHRQHFEHFGNTMPLPVAVLLEVFDMAEASIAAPAVAKKVKAAASDTLVAN